MTNPALEGLSSYTTPGDTTEGAQAVYQLVRTPSFTVRFLRDNNEYLESDYTLDTWPGADDPIDSQRPTAARPSNDDPPADDEIWRATVYAPTDPTDSRHPHDIVVEECDLMLPASITDISQSNAPLPTGPRFAAKVRVRGLSDIHH